MNPRSRRRGMPVQNPVSLFPFMSVLTCMIGALVLGVTVLSIVSTKMRITPGQEEYVKIVDAIRGLKINQTETERLIVQSRALVERLRELGLELARLKAAKSASDRSEQQLVRMLENISDARARIAKLASLRSELEAKLEPVREKLKALPAAGAIKVVAAPRLTGASGEQGESAKRPLFVECVGEQVIVHPEGARVQTRSIETSDVLNQLFERVQRNRSDGAILILLIRPDGVKTFDRLHRVVRAKKVRYGYTVVPGHGPLDLSDFKAAGK